ncbi:sigma-70 family RNA polymerase sigma factor [Algoriphagus pacificus]|uniref:Sigma-70 family RNA polymerase sigma factor n=1 Tax=Algoriphagus pacificus TaxID=2811234 RepID=A0ABS3CE35_9BACT|nr:sigma-70 family RNA polymerase sigma factor [Algoriphagus pacificus]MBN7815282.1 sigma-70 family RNA polymerase sigma factor [Algoriphagus pacificus]
MQPLQNKVQFEQLFKDNWELMYQSALYKLKDPSLAEDIVQDIFLDLWKRKDKLVLQSEIKVYLLTAVKYSVMKCLDEVAKRQESQLEIASGFYSEEVLSFEEIYNEIEVAIEKIPPKARMVFKMNKLEGMNVNEIAEKLQLSPQTVHNQLSKSMKILRGELKHIAPLISMIFLN